MDGGRVANVTKRLDLWFETSTSTNYSDQNVWGALEGFDVTSEIVYFN